MYFYLHTPPYGHPSFKRGMFCDALKVREFRRAGMFLVVGLILCSEVGRLRRADFYYFIIADTSVTLAPAWCGKCRCRIMGLVYMVVRK